MSTILASAEILPASAQRRRLPLILLSGALFFLWFILCRQLSYKWSANEQYAYGWFVPFFCVYLFWLRWQDFPGGTTSLSSAIQKPGRDEARPSKWIFLCAVPLLLLLLFVRLFEIANPDWRPLSWIHAFIVVGFTLLILYSLGGFATLRQFAFPVCFILVAVPWVTPIEEPIVQGLMKTVAAVAAETLSLCGIPAQLEGSLIRVHSGVVGVSEACSGVRSLQISIMIGLLFGELKRLTIWRRVVLLAAAVFIALWANFARAFFLVWVAATQNLAAVGRWHDFAGYAIVIAVFLGTIAVAVKLESRTPKGETQQSSVARAHRFTLPSSTFYFLLSTFCWLLLIEASVAGWYRWHEQKFVTTIPWQIRWPETKPGFRETPIEDRVKEMLRYDAGREGSWPVTFLIGTAKAAEARLTMFFFRWNPGSGSVLRARAHRPDICLPFIGWSMKADDGVRFYSVSSQVSLPFRHFRFVHEVRNGRQAFAQAFFCEREDRLAPSGPDQFDATSGESNNWMRSDRVRVVRQGLRNQGQQVLEIVFLTSEEIGRAAAETEFAQLVPTLVTLQR